MIRDFSMEKKEELYRNLEVIDHKEWKSFMIWCGGRAGEFGVWADKLGISAYTGRIDNYQNRVLDTNSSTRNQIDVIFENVAETDRRYAGIFRGYAETVKEQMARVQVMAEVMESACGIGLDNGIMLFEMEKNSVSQREEMILKGREILMRRLESEGNMGLEERQKICDMIMQNQPTRLINLYVTERYSSADTNTVYISIKNYYNRHKMDITIDDVKDLDLGEGMDQTQKETFVACWNRLGQMGLSEEHIIAAMANIYAESRFSATNAQDSYGYTGLYDDDYEFKTNDKVGYGICQWTVEDRKVELENFVNTYGGSVYDLETQLNYFQYEMEVGIRKTQWQTFLSRNSRDEAVEIFWNSIEISWESLQGKGSPIYEDEKEKRIGFANDIADWYDTTFQ